MTRGAEEGRGEEGRGEKTRAECIRDPIPSILAPPLSLLSSRFSLDLGHTRASAGTWLSQPSPARHLRTLEIIRSNELVSYPT
jgi:hypothetical protein